MKFSLLRPLFCLACVLALSGCDSFGGVSDTVTGWVPIVFTAMPQWQGIQRGVRGSRYTTYLPSCLDTDLFYSKIEYAQGSNPDEKNLILWWYNSTANTTRIRMTSCSGVRTGRS